MSKPKIIFLTGSGISEESGIPTYRDENGIWNRNDFDQVSSKNAWKKDRESVLRFLEKMRQTCQKANPNIAHKIIAELEEHFDVTVLTQNVDTLHEQAGSSNVIHLHGRIDAARSTVDTKLKYPITEPVEIGMKCEKGSQLRHDVVLFGEDVPEYNNAKKLIKDKQLKAIVVVGTSLQVYPVSELPDLADPMCTLVSVNPNQRDDRMINVTQKASTGMQKVKEMLMDIYLKK